MGYIGNNLQQQVTQPATQFFSGNGSTTTFVLNQTPQSVYTVEVIVNNVQQNPQTSYYVTGNTLIFYSAPPSGSSNIYVNYNPVITQAGLPGYGTVGTNQLGQIANIASGVNNFTIQTGGNNTTALTINSSTQAVTVPGNTTMNGLTVNGGATFTTSVGIAGNGDLSLSRNDGYDFSIVMPSSMVSANKRLYIQQAGGGNIYGLQINASFVLQPSQPSFMASGNYGQTNFATSTKITFDTVQYNVGGAYNASTSRFTAPVSGRYFFSYNVYRYDAAPQICIRINNTESTFSGDVVPNTIQTQTNATGGCAFILQLSANDYVEVFNRSAGGAGNIYGRHSHFSGHLLG